MLIKDSTDFGISTYSLSQMRDEEWNQIRKYKARYKIIEQNPKIENLLYPGFCFSNASSVREYYNKTYNIFENIFTPPRGNLTKSNKWIVVGIKPGTYYAHYSKAESSWLLGPSSKMLHRLLYETQIYPYFTNVYKTYLDEENGDISDITNEIINICRLYLECYGIDSKSLNVLFLGNYPEYDKLKALLSHDFNFISPKFYTIWHPAYILRKNTEEMFNKWVYQFQSKL